MWPNHEKLHCFRLRSESWQEDTDEQRLYITHHKEQIPLLKNVEMTVGKKHWGYIY